MFDRQIQNFIQKPLMPISKFFLKFLSPNQMTIIGFVFGILMCISIFFKLYLFALFLLILNRLCDGLDGSMARILSPTPIGGYLDIVFDFIIYAAFVLCFGLSNKDYNIISLILLFSYFGTGTTFLAKASIIPMIDYIKETNDLEISKSFYYAQGLVEGAETFIYMILCLIFPNLFFSISVIFVFLCIITAMSRIFITYKKFNN